MASPSASSTTQPTSSSSVVHNSAAGKRPRSSEIAAVAQPVIASATSPQTAPMPTATAAAPQQASTLGKGPHRRYFMPDLAAATGRQRIANRQRQQESRESHRRALLDLEVSSISSSASASELPDDMDMQSTFDDGIEDASALAAQPPSSSSQAPSSSSSSSAAAAASRSPSSSESDDEIEEDDGKLAQFYAALEAAEGYITRVDKHLVEEVAKIKNLDLSRLGENLTNSELESILDRFPNIESLNLHGVYRLTLKCLKPLASMPNLHFLDLRGAHGIYYSDLTAHPVLPKIQGLSTGDSVFIEDRHYAILSQIFPATADLQIHGIGSSEIPLSSLASFKSLKSLRLFSFEFTDQSIDNIFKIKQLSSLSMDRAELSLAGYSKLRLLRNVNLYLTDCYITAPEAGPHAHSAICAALELVGEQQKTLTSVGKLPWRVKSKEEYFQIEGNFHPKTSR